MERELSREWLTNYFFLALSAPTPVVKAVDAGLRGCYLDASECHKLMAEKLFPLSLMYPSMELYETGGVEVGIVDTGCGMYTDNRTIHTTLEHFGCIRLETTEYQEFSYMTFSLRLDDYRFEMALGKHNKGLWRKLPKCGIYDHISIAASFLPFSALHCLDLLLAEARSTIFQINEL